MLHFTKRQVVRILILWLPAFISTFKRTSGSGKVTVQLVDYKNSESRDYNGDCCDNLNWCVNDCDNYFHLCFANTTSADKCALWNGWTTVLGGDSFSFPKSLGNGIMNPLIHSFTHWQPILFSVEVWDDDTGSANDLVNRYSLSIQTTPSSSTSTAAKRHKLSGKGSSYLSVDVKVFCDTNYFVPDCSTHCTPRDDDSGHYTCDFTRGQKVCLSGWHGSDCLTYCVFRNDSSGHYSCDANGQIKCLENWYGRDCLRYCKARNDSSGHHSCDVSGQRWCLPGWHGNHCLTYCVARNDSVGHYSCDANGQRKCLSGWHGSNCLAYCVSRNDSLGHYSCDANGQRKCSSGWHGNHCLTYCVARNDSLGHYSCDAVGQRKCLSEWHGSDCLIYCVSRNDSLGHYSCDVNGVMKCLDNWYGKGCLIHCKPRNDSLGHYTCNSTGCIVCLPGWRGEKCTESEMPRASFTTSVISSTKGLQRKMSSSREPSLAGYSSLRIDASTLLPTSSFMPLVSTDKEVILQPTETARITIPSKLQSISGLQPQMSSSQDFSLQPSASSQQTYALTFMAMPSIESPYTKGEERTLKQTKSTKATIPSKLYSTLRQSISQTRESSLRTCSTSVLISRSSTEILYTKHKKLTAQPTEILRVTIPSTLNSISRQDVLQTRASNLKASAISPSTPILRLVSSPSVKPPCHGGDETIAEPTFQPKETSVNSGILVEFQEKEEHELVVLRVKSTIKIFLAERLNKICRRNAETCSLTGEDTHSAWFCPRDVNVQIHDVTEKGVSLKIASKLPPPLRGMVPSQTLKKILNKSREDLKNATQADIIWIHADGLTTPRTRIYGKPDQLSRVSKRQSASPLPYILGIAGSALLLAVILFVVRAKVAKRNMIHPDRDDGLSSPPPPEYQAESDTIVLLSQTKGKYAYKSKQKTGLSVHGDFKVADDIEEIYL